MTGEISETDDDTMVDTSWTSGSWSVSNSAVATSFNRNMINVLKVPAICPALAGEPIRASTSDQESSCTPRRPVLPIWVVLEMCKGRLYTFTHDRVVQAAHCSASTKPSRLASLWAQTPN